MCTRFFSFEIVVEYRLRSNCFSYKTPTSISRALPNETRLLNVCCRQNRTKTHVPLTGSIFGFKRIHRKKTNRLHTSCIWRKRRKTLSFWRLLRDDNLLVRFDSKRLICKYFTRQSYLYYCLEMEWEWGTIRPKTFAIFLDGFVCETVWEFKVFLYGHKWCVVVPYCCAAKSVYMHFGERPFEHLRNYIQLRYLYFDVGRSCNSVFFCTATAAGKLYGKKQICSWQQVVF